MQVGIWRPCGTAQKAIPDPHPVPCLNLQKVEGSARWSHCIPEPCTPSPGQGAAPLPGKNLRQERTPSQLIDRWEALGWHCSARPCHLPPPLSRMGPSGPPLPLRHTSSSATCVSWEAQAVWERSAFTKTTEGPWAWAEISAIFMLGVEVISLLTPSFRPS